MSVTHYVPCKGDLVGPEFPTMTEANLWIFSQSDSTGWTVKLLRKPSVSAEVSWASSHSHLGGANNEA